MKKSIGMFISTDENGGTVTNKVFKYDSYQEMIDDTTPGRYGIVNNVVYSRTGGEWHAGFPTFLNSNDYTAFEVYPTDHDIQIGSSELGEILWNDATLTTHSKIPASMTEEFTLWITRSRLESDIVIDWGDGTVEKLSELTPTSGTSNDGQIDVLVYVAHTYEVPNKTYVVKIYGKDYCRLSHNQYKLSSANRLVCRAFTNDLPIASHLTNLASIFFGNRRLLKVEFPSYTDLFNRVINWSSAFNTCHNLVSCIGWPSVMHEGIYGQLFSYAQNMKETDFKIPHTNVGSLADTFNENFNLEMDVAKLFDGVKLQGNPISVKRLFYKCAKLYGNVPDHILWNNPNITFSDTENAFAGCSDEIRAQVPVSWGGSLESN